MEKMQRGWRQKAGTKWPTPLRSDRARWTVGLGLLHTPTNESHRFSSFQDALASLWTAEGKKLQDVIPLQTPQQHLCGQARHRHAGLHPETHRGRAEPRGSKTSGALKGNGGTMPTWHFRPKDKHFYTETQRTAARSYFPRQTQKISGPNRRTHKYRCVSHPQQSHWGTCAAGEQQPLYGLKHSCTYLGPSSSLASEVWVRPSSLAYHFSQASERFLCLDVISDSNNHNTLLTTPDLTAANSTTAFPHRAPPICSEGWVSKENNTLEAADPNITLTAILGKKREAKREQFCRLLYVKRLSLGWAGYSQMGMDTWFTHYHIMTVKRNYDSVCFIDRPQKLVWMARK